MSFFDLQKMVGGLALFLDERYKWKAESPGFVGAGIVW